MAEPIEIIIKQGSSSGEGERSSADVSAPNKKKEEKRLSKGEYIALALAKEVVNFSANVISTQASLQSQMSGDYVSAERTQKMVEIVNGGIQKGLSIAISGKLIGEAFNISGPAGMAIAAGITLLKTGYNTYVKVQSNINNLRIEQINTYQNIERAGMPIYSGSRNTRY